MKHALFSKKTEKGVEDLRPLWNEMKAKDDERRQLRAEVNALRAFKAAVPWQALDTVMHVAQSSLHNYEEHVGRRLDTDCKTCYAWYTANAPKEAA